MIGRIVVLGSLKGREAAALVVDGQLQDLLIGQPEDAMNFCLARSCEGTSTGR